MPTIYDQSRPKVQDIPQGFSLLVPTQGTFDIRPSHISLVERNLFGGLPDEDLGTHVEIFTDYCCSISVPAGVTQDKVKETLFPYSLKDSTREWYRYLDKVAAGVTNWTSLDLAFYKRYYPPVKTNALRSQITNFQQGPDEELHEAWVRFKKLVRSVTHHGFQHWYLCNQFYNALYDDYRVILDAVANGRFQKNVDSNKGWNTIEEMAVHRAEYGSSRGNSRKPSDEMSVVVALEASINARFKNLEFSKASEKKIEIPVHNSNETAELREIVQALLVQVTKIEEARIESARNFEKQLEILAANQVANSSSKCEVPIETLNAIHLRSGLSYDGSDKPRKDSENDEKSDLNSGAKTNSTASASGNHEFGKALCDLGASVGVMPYSVCEKLNIGNLKVTNMTLQMADRSIQRPLGILEDVPVQVGKFFIPVDFIVLDIGEDSQIPIILGRPFLHTAGAVIDVKRGVLTLERESLAKDPLVDLTLLDECAVNPAKNADELDVLEALMEGHEHTEEEDEMITSLANANLFMVNGGVVLGHLISDKGIHVDKAKVQVIEKLPPPVNVKGVKGGFSCGANHSAA
ncbi:uncharacterized protein LOC141629003 [Silene latifolia]|uniref:uncharacterized protein LOC141629003 n=1 Tax=Silene latifolia TaxID=37657 RepID=UPI003D77F6AB